MSCSYHVQAFFHIFFLQRFVCKVLSHRQDCSQNGIRYNGIFSPGSSSYIAFLLGRCHRILAGPAIMVRLVLSMKNSSLEVKRILLSNPNQEIGFFPENDSICVLLNFLLSKFDKCAQHIYNQVFSI